MKIGFIGCGNMASAIINGIIDNKAVNSSDVYAYDIYEPAVNKAVESKQINACKSEIEVVKSSDIILLAVKPNVQASVLNTIDGEVGDKLLISIAAGKTIEFIESNLKCKAKIVRVMPNINAKVGEAISAYCFNELVNDDDKANVELLLNAIGKVLCLDESFFPLFGVIGGCGPAFAYMFIDAMARAGVKNGMKKSDALMISAQTVLGSAKMILESGEHPWQLIDNVCSPGGTTIEGVTSLQADGFEAAVHNAVDKALDKDKKL
ncbi:MAG: pyrroline-5-carboxylate reductase [Eubacteriales bacterium]|nr:pyrroline-5-carboxylate reductase [Eubacteriales bacterium]